MSKFITYLRFVKKRVEVKSHFYWMFFLSLIGGAAVFLIPILQKGLIDSIFIQDQNYMGLIGFFFISMLLVGTGILQALLLNKIFLKLKSSLQREMIHSLSVAESPVVKKRGAGAFMSSVFGDSEQIASLINENYFSGAIGIVVALAMLLYSLKWTILFSLIVGVTYIIIFFAVRYFNRRFTKYFEMTREQVMLLNPKLLEYIENRNSVMCFSDVAFYESRLWELMQTRDSYLKKAVDAETMSEAFISATKTTAMTFFFVLSIFQIRNNTMSVGELIAMLSYLNYIFVPVGFLQQLSMGLDRFEMLTGKVKDSIDYDVSTNLPETGELILRECKFSYDSKAEKMQTNFNDTILLDKMIAVVGLSGEGKSTLLKLISGQISPLSGSVEMGGVPVSEIPKHLLFAGMRYYPQESEIYDADLYFNLTLGRKELSEKEYPILLSKVQFDLERELRSVAEGKRGSYPLIDQILMLPELEKQRYYLKIKEEVMGRDLTKMSKFIGECYVAGNYYVKERLELLVEELRLSSLKGRKLGQRGAEISGGEKNRIALGRFLLSEKSTVFLMDEPFLSLDNITLDENLEMLRSLLKHRRGILISHNFKVISTLADEVIFINNGQVEERGTHEELLQKNKLYQELYSRR